MGIGQGIAIGAAFAGTAAAFGGLVTVAMKVDAEANGDDFTNPYAGSSKLANLAKFSAVPAGAGALAIAGAKGQRQQMLAATLAGIAFMSVAGAASMALADRLSG